MPILFFIATSIYARSTVVTTGNTAPVITGDPSITEGPVRAEAILWRDL